jgi:hypothetical protein
LTRSRQHGRLNRFPDHESGDNILPSLIIPGTSRRPQDAFGPSLVELTALIDEAGQRQRIPKNAAYLLVLALQIFGAIVFIRQELPEFEQLLLNPGEQLPKDIHSDLIMIGIFCVMQISFWCRLLYVPIPFRRPNLFLNHVLLFLGRLSFVFGGAFFAVVVFRHLPGLGRDTDVLLATGRGIIFVGCLFALFCTSLEVERLGQAFERSRN